MIRIGKLPSNYGPASVLGVAIGALTGALTSKVLCEIPIPFVIHDWDQHLAGWLSLRLHNMNPIFFSEIATRYQYFLDTAGVPAWQITGRFDLAAVVGLCVCAAATWLIGKPLPDTKIIAGPRLFEGRDAHRRLKKVMRDECSISGDGLKIHKDFDWQISRDRESRHFFLIGSPGGGKTQILTSLILAAIARGDKVIIFDIKGDFTATLPGDFVLFAPWDSRGYSWNVARDCVNTQHARQLADEIVPEGKEPIWHDSARQILVGVIQRLQVNDPKGWSWNDLYRLTIQTPERLLELTDEFAPELAALLVSGSRTTDSILSNLVSAMSIIKDLAQAWKDVPTERRFSVSEWLADPNPKSKTVILQGNGEYEKLMKGYVKGIVTTLAGRINSAEFGDDRERRIFLALDEFPQLGRLDKISTILEVGRSKGVSVILGAQDQAQIKEIYGPHVGSAWGSMVGTQFIVRVSPGDTAKWISQDVIGFAILEKTTIQDGKPVTGPQFNQLLMEPNDLSAYLGPTKEGVRCLILGMGEVYILTIPYTTLPKLRKAMVPGRLTLPTGSLRENAVSSSQVVTPLPENNKQQKQGETHMQEEQKKPRLVLRQPTREEIIEMAESGSDIKDLADEIDEMVAGALELTDE